MVGSYETIEHTADTGIRAWGRSPAEMYESAAKGMLRLVVDPAAVRPLERDAVRVSGTDAVDLLVVWLHEILYMMDAKKRIYADVHVEDFTEWRIEASLLGEPLDLSRHAPLGEIKGVPYHAARVERADDGWRCQVLFDV